MRLHERKGLRNQVLGPSRTLPGIRICQGIRLQVHGSGEACIHDVEATAGLSSVKIGRSSLFLLNYLSHTYGFEFPLPIWPLCASHQRWKQLFCHSSSQWLAPKLGKKVFLPKRSEKDLFLPFPNIYLKLIHVQSCYLLPCMNIMVASRCLFLYFCWKNVVFFSISAGNNVVFAPFTKHNTKYSLNSG